MTNLAAAMSYYAFLAIPSLLLVLVGVFGLFGGGNAVEEIIDRLHGLMPQEALTLLEDSLKRMTELHSNSTIAMIATGSVVALWTVTGAMQTLMWALDSAYDVEETRGFVKQRLTALGMFLLLLVSFVLVFGLVVLGPHLSRWLGDASDAETLVQWVWWTGQWPVLILWLLLTASTILYFGPNVEHRRWRDVTPGAAVSVVVWLVTSGAFGYFVSEFGSYNKTWGSLAAVIIMLTWLWIAAVALLYGAEVNAEAARTRERV